MDHRYTSDKEILYSRETLQAYVLGNLEEKQIKEIAEAAKESEALAIRIEGMRLLLEEGGVEGLDSFLNESWSQLDENIGELVRKESSKSGSSRPPFLNYAMAAAIALLLAVGALLINRMDSEGDLLDEALAASFPLIHTQSVRGNSLEKEPWEQAYTKNDFALVIRELSTQTDQSETESFYLGMSYLKLREYAPATEAYQKVIDLNNLKGFLEQARWFCSLAYIQLGQLPEAKALLEVILQKEGHYKQKEAQELWKHYSST